MAITKSLEIVLSVDKGLPQNSQIASKSDNSVDWSFSPDAPCRRSSGRNVFSAFSFYHVSRLKPRPTGSFANPQWMGATSL